MEQQEDLAIVLRVTAYQERHRIVSALTENHGVVSAMAHNAVQSRRFGGALDLFTAAAWKFVVKPGTDLWRLDEATTKKAFVNIHRDFEILALASVLNEMILRLAPRNEPAPDLFKLHSNALTILDELPLQGKVALLNAYIVKILHWSGCQPQLNRCLGCETDSSSLHSDESVAVDVENAGWLCNQCKKTQAFAHLRLTRNALDDAQAAFSLPIRKAFEIVKSTPEEQVQAFASLEAFLIWHLPGLDQEPLKGLKFLGLKSSSQPLQRNSPQRQHRPA